MAPADVDVSANPLAPRVEALSEQEFIDRARAELYLIYGGERTEAILRRLLQQLGHYRQEIATPSRALWSEATQILICYGDSLIDGEGHRTPLQALDNFLDGQMRDTFSAVHILPFFPWSSDDGFSVVHFREVNSDLGDWADIHRITKHHNLMADLVINHVSRESLWFTDFLAGTQPGRDYFIELDPGTDVSMVTRPRNTPLLVPVYTRRGKRYVWATFSDDQIDLNYANPDVLLEMLGVLLHYLAQGVRLVRLDAVAFLWKELGTRCIHLPQTHAVVRLIRAIIDHVAPGALLITETNVPHLENLSYFGDRSGGDGAEAHMVYQFTLPPLLVHTLTSGDAAALTEWAATLPELPNDCTYFNFTASHDGIGVRALEGLLPDHEIKQLLDLMQRFGGYISMKTDSDGRDSPYEINITYFDAMKGTRKGEDPWQILRFLCSQTIMMGLQGIPGVYFHSLTGTTNDHENVSRTGKLRAINRKHWRREELDHLIGAMTPTRFVFKAMTQLLNKRRREPCFHPNVPQRVIDLGPGIFAFLRGPMADGRRLLAIHSVTDQPIELHLPQAYLTDRWEDLLGHFDPLAEKPLLKPYYSAWLVSQPG
ncbi:sugar phosphorylase [Halotalea alkalilenta]|uniref:sugar phosphorylase n=1 Tax=Halotalea alkalilenta TaxID=376489 RepID=UPI00048190CE|nr:sugar phosphorylase [Halotalea alkalilenta]